MLRTFNQHGYEDETGGTDEMETTDYPERKEKVKKIHIGYYLTNYTVQESRLIE